jgi:hypothetical protein
VGAGWYLLVLLGIPLVELMGAFAVLGSVPLDDLAQNWSVIFTAYLPAVLYVAIFTGWARSRAGEAVPSQGCRSGTALSLAPPSCTWYGGCGTCPTCCSAAGRGCPCARCRSDLLGVALRGHNGPVAPGATGAGGCPVGIGVSLRLR